MQIVTVLTQKPGEGSVGVACNVAASGPRSHQRFGARAYRCRPYCGRQDQAGLAVLVHQECVLVPIRKARSRRASVLLRVGDPVGDGTRCEIWTNHFRAVHAKELGKP